MRKQTRQPHYVNTKEGNDNSCDDLDVVQCTAPF